MNFHQLHQQKTPLLLANVWDVASAQAAQQQGYPAVGTSSAAIARALGYNDGEELDFAELLYLVKRISAVTILPLTVDIESGYGAADAVVKHAIALVAMGVCGINIEDSSVSNGERSLACSSTLMHIIKSLKQHKATRDLFINARTDTYLLDCENKQQETQKRIADYAQAGADGIFIPCIQESAEIAAAVNCTPLPINVMCMPKLPTFSELTALGVKRISMGNFMFEKMQTQLAQTLGDVQQQQSFKPLF